MRLVALLTNYNEGSVTDSATLSTRSKPLRAIVRS